MILWDLRENKEVTRTRRSIRVPEKGEDVVWKDKVYLVRNVLNDWDEDEIYVEVEHVGTYTRNVQGDGES